MRVFATVCKLSSVACTQGLSELSLFANGTILGWEEHTVVMEAVAGFRLPGGAGPPGDLSAYSLNDPRFLIGSNAAAGQNGGSPLDSAPALPRMCGEECAAWQYGLDNCLCRAK